MSATDDWKGEDRIRARRPAAAALSEQDRADIDRLRAAWRLGLCEAEACRISGLPLRRIRILQDRTGLHLPDGRIIRRQGGRA